MADSRIKDLPDAAPLVDADFLAVDSTAGGTRKTTVSSLKAASAATRPFQVTAAGLILTVTAGTRLLRSGASLSYAGGTVSAPGADGVYFVCHTVSNTLAVLAAWPAAIDSLVLGRVTVSGAGTVATVVPNAPLGGNLQAAHNLADVSSVVTARNNLGLGFTYQQAANITATGNTELVVADANTDGVMRYTVVAGTSAYTNKINVSSAGASPNGTKVTIVLEMPGAPVNAPTIEIRSGSGGSGTLLATILSGPFARTERIELVYNPTTWVLVSVGPEPHAGAQQLSELACNSAPQGAIKFDGSASNKFAEGAVRGITIGTGDYSAVITFRCINNLEASANMGLFSVGAPGAAPATPGQLGMFCAPASSNYLLTVRDAGGVNQGPAVSLAAYVGRTVQLAVTRKAGAISLFVDGAPVPIGPISSAAVAMAGPDTNFLIGNFVGSTNSYRERIHSFQLYNRALTSAELRMLEVRGVATEDRFATGPWISPVIFNGGFETAGAGGADVFASWNESAPAGGAIVRDTSIFAPDGGVASCRFDMDGSNPACVISQPLVEPVRNYRLTGKVRSNRPAGTVGIQYQLNHTLAQFYQFPVAFAQNTWGDFSFETTSGNNVATGLGTIALYRNSAEDTGFSRWFDTFTLERIGCLVDIDCGAGSGFSLPDLQGRYPLVVTPLAYANVQHSRPARAGQFYHRVAASGPTQIAGIPATARIAAIVADANGAVTISMGTASGGSQIVASVALTTGKNDLTLVARYSSAQTLWVSHSVATPVAYTVMYDIVGPAGS